MTPKIFCIRPQAVPKFGIVPRFAFRLVLAVVMATAGLAQTPPKTGPGAAVPIVKNGKRPVPPASGPRFALEPLWTIGGEDAPPEQDFSGVEAVAVDPTGTVLVLDSKESRVLTFDGKGALSGPSGARARAPASCRCPSASS